jgi:GNAT superfamily N-acetyltransferase
MNMQISEYIKERDEENLMNMIRNEGQKWVCYWGEDVSARYRKALHHSITYVAYEGDTLCGYSRSIDDNGFYIYVCDLLVMREYRGKNLGRKLMECVYSDYPEAVVYVMSDVDGYYRKQGYHREGSIFEVSKVESLNLK